MLGRAQGEADGGGHPVVLDETAQRAAPAAADVQDAAAGAGRDALGEEVVLAVEGRLQVGRVRGVHRPDVYIIVGPSQSA